MIYHRNAILSNIAHTVERVKRKENLINVSSLKNSTAKTIT